MKTIEILDHKSNILFFQSKIPMLHRMIDNLIEESNNLSLSTKIWEYIASVEKNAKLHYQDEKYPKELLAWLDWANIQANKIAPLKDKFPSYVLPFDLIDKSKIL